MGNTFNIGQVNFYGSNQPRIIFTIRMGQLVIEGATNMILSAVQQVELSIQPVDAKGNPAAVDGVPVWRSSNPEVLDVDPSDAEGMKATAVAHKVGVAQVSVTCDADMGEGTRHIAGTLDVEVVAAEAVGVAIVPGAPTDQPV